MKKYLQTLDPKSDDAKFAFNDLGVAYFKPNDISNAKKYWRKVAKLGNTTSSNNLKELTKTK